MNHKPFENPSSDSETGDMSENMFYKASLERGEDPNRWMNRGKKQVSEERKEETKKGMKQEDS